MDINAFAESGSSPPDLSPTSLDFWKCLCVRLAACPNTIELTALRWGCVWAPNSKAACCTPRDCFASHKAAGSLCFLQGLLIICAGKSTLPQCLALTKETIDLMGSSNLSSTDWIHLGWRERSSISIKLRILHRIQCLRSLKANIFTEFYSEV